MLLKTTNLQALPTWIRPSTSHMMENVLLQGISTNYRNSKVMRLENKSTRIREEDKYEYQREMFRS